MELNVGLIDSKLLPKGASHIKVTDVLKIGGGYWSSVYLIGEEVIDSIREVLQLWANSAR